MAETKYIHGFAESERERLLRQGDLLAEFVYPGVALDGCVSILEVGSGVGAQTLQLLKRFPKARITCVERSEEQLDTARKILKQSIQDGRVTLIHASAEEMPFGDHSFDGAFIFWLLEHVPHPPAILSEVKRVLKPGSRLFIREVFNQLWYTDPPSATLNGYWRSFNEQQLKLGGDPFVGVRLGSYLQDVGFNEIQVEFRTPFFDKRNLKTRDELLYYWRDLFLSGETPSAEMRKEIPQEFERLKNNSNSSIFFGFSAGQAKAPI